MVRDNLLFAGIMPKSSRISLISLDEDLNQKKEELVLNSNFEHTEIASAYNGDEPFLLTLSKDRSGKQYLLSHTLDGKVEEFHRVLDENDRKIHLRSLFVDRETNSIYASDGKNVYDFNSNGLLIGKHPVSGIPVSYAKLDGSLLIGNHGGELFHNWKNVANAGNKSPTRLCVFDKKLYVVNSRLANSRKEPEGLVILDIPNFKRNETELKKFEYLEVRDLIEREGKLIGCGYETVFQMDPKDNSIKVKKIEGLRGYLDTFIPVKVGKREVLFYLNGNHHLGNTDFDFSKGTEEAKTVDDTWFTGLTNIIKKNK